MTEQQNDPTLLVLADSVRSLNRDPSVASIATVQAAMNVELRSVSSANGVTRATIAWIKPSDENIDRFEVWLGGSGITPYLVASVTDSPATFTVAVTANTTYVAYLRTINKDGLSTDLDASPTVTFTAQAGGGTNATQIQGVNVNAAAPANNQVLKYDSANSRWTPAVPYLSTVGVPATSVLLLTTNYQDVPGASISLTTGYWLVFAEFYFADYVASDGILQGALVQSGTMQGRTINVYTNTVETQALTTTGIWRLLISGTETVKLQARKLAGGSSSAKVAETATCLIALQLY